MINDKSRSPKRAGHFFMNNKNSHLLSVYSVLSIGYRAKHFTQNISALNHEVLFI